MGGQVLLAQQLQALTARSAWFGKLRHSNLQAAMGIVSALAHQEGQRQAALHLRQQQACMLLPEDL